MNASPNRVPSERREIAVQEAAERQLQRVLGPEEERAMPTSSAARTPIPTMT